MTPLFHAVVFDKGFNNEINLNIPVKAIGISFRHITVI